MDLSEAKELAVFSPPASVKQTANLGIPRSASRISHCQITSY